MSPKLTYVLGLLISLALSACGGNSSTTTINPGAVVAVAPVISAEPSQVLTLAGSTATYSVAATGSNPLQYQWYKNGAPILGATAASYTTPALSVADNAASYVVKVANSAGTATSLPASLQIGQTMSSKQNDDFIKLVIAPIFIENAAHSALLYNDLVFGHYQPAHCDPSGFGANVSLGTATVKVNGVVNTALIPALGGSAGLPSKTVLEADFNQCIINPQGSVTGKINTVYEVIKSTPTETIKKTTSTTANLLVANQTFYAFVFSGTVVTTETITLDANNKLTLSKVTTVAPGSVLKSTNSATEFNYSSISNTFNLDGYSGASQNIFKHTSLFENALVRLDTTKESKYTNVFQSAFLWGGSSYKSVGTDTQTNYLSGMKLLENYDRLLNLYKNNLLIGSQHETFTGYSAVLSDFFPFY